MVPLPIDNELDHTSCARSFIEKYVLARLSDRFPNLTNFLTLDLSLRTQNGYCLPDFVVISVVRSAGSRPKQRTFGFELKVPAGVSLNAIKQVCRQRASVDGAFLLLLLPTGYPEEKRLSQIREAARSEGIGLIRVKDWRYGREYELMEQPKLSPPSDLASSNVIRGHLSGSEKSFLKRWMTA